MGDTDSDSLIPELRAARIVKKYPGLGGTTVIAIAVNCNGMERCIAIHPAPSQKELGPYYSILMKPRVPLRWAPLHQGLSYIAPLGLL